MDPIVDTAELPKSPEFSLDKASIVEKLHKRIASSKPADVLCLDVDGTVYTKEQKSEGTWTKIGNNEKASEQLKQKSIPHILVSGRPDWNNESDEEMQKLGLSKADVIICAAGRTIYWRNTAGELVLDRKFQDMMNNQAITYTTEDGKRIETNFDAFKIRDLVNQQVQKNPIKGIEQVKVDNPNDPKSAFTTLDVNNMSFDKLQEVIRGIRTSISGVKVEFSEDLERVSENTFSGWIQIVPQKGGKDGSLRYILETIAKKINPYNEPHKNPVASVVGDGSIDIWMLAMGQGDKDPYNLKQFGLGNLTPHARAKLEKVVGALSNKREDGMRRAHLQIIEQKGDNGVLQVINFLQ